MFQSSILRFTAVFASVVLIAGCEHYIHGDKPTTNEKIIDVPVNVSIERDASGDFKFRYAASDFSDEEGNLDFTGVSAKGTQVKIHFVIGPGSPEGLTFKREGRDAMWIIEKAQLKDPNDSPPAPYQGEQFYDFETSRDGKRLMVMNQNNDGILYRYNLRFDFEGGTVVHDPDAENGDWD